MVDFGMALQPLRRYCAQVKGEVREALENEYTARETAASFAFASFIVILPTFIFGLALFAVLAVKVDRANPVALFAPAIVFNPVVKTPLYGAAYSVGTGIMTPVQGVVPVLLEGAYLVTLQFAVGIVVVAAGVAFLSYVVLAVAGNRYG